MEKRLEIEKKDGQLFRYRKANNFTLDELENGYIYFPSNIELNDPFDASHHMLRLTEENSEMQKLYNELLDQSPDELTKNYIRKKYENNPEKLRELVISGTKKFISTHGIACFTVSPIHIPLWAYYANNHEGICIQYDTNLDKSFFDKPRRIDYVKDFEIIDYEPITNPQNAMNVFYKKINLWDKEFEVRLIKPTLGKHKINTESIRSIILGLNAKSDYTEKIIDIVQRKYKHATLFSTEIMTEKIGLSFIPYNL